MMQRVFVDGPAAADRAPMRVGIVCPYSLDVPGGVQNHVKDLAEALIARGHACRVLAPSESDDLPAYVVPAGRTAPVPYNGSVARLSFGPVSRPGPALAAGGRLRRPAPARARDPQPVAAGALGRRVPGRGDVPLRHRRSRALSASAAILRPSLEKITRPDRGLARTPATSRSATSAASRWSSPTGCTSTGSPRAAPRGAGAATRRARSPSSAGSGSHARASSCSPGVRRRRGRPARAPAARGRRRGRRGGAGAAARRGARPGDVPGPASDDDKAAALRTADVYVAPNTGGESFGIVLVEAMAAGATVLASDLPAFRRVLDDGALRCPVPQRRRRRPGARGWRRCSTTRPGGPPWTRRPAPPSAATTGRRSPARSCGSTRRSSAGCR